MENWWCESCAGVCFLDCHGRCSHCGSDLLISCAALYVDLYAPMQSAAIQTNPVETLPSSEAGEQAGT